MEPVDAVRAPRSRARFLAACCSRSATGSTEAAEPWPADDMPKVVTKRQPTAEEWTALRFAWRVCAHVKSNAVIFTGADRTLAIGAGQMSRVDAVKVAVMKAGGSLAGSVAASDAFFPFRDGLDAVAAAGATAVVQPGGSVRDAEVIAAADEHGLAMVVHRPAAFPPLVHCIRSSQFAVRRVRDPDPDSGLMLADAGLGIRISDSRISDSG